MNSEDWFKQEGSKWKDKSGIYVIEQPLFSLKLGFPVYKIGYARHSLYTRVRDYKTAYGLIPFKIFCVYHIPAGVKGRRVNFDNLCERIIHATLKKYSEWSGEGEWFKNIQLIMNVVYELKKQNEEQIPNAKKWKFYSSFQDHPSLNKIVLVKEKDITGTFKDIEYGKDGLRTKEKTIYVNGKKYVVPSDLIDDPDMIDEPIT
jgi:hypothetical protein